MTEQSDSSKVIKCCDTHYPRWPYWHVEQKFDFCCIGCDKPGPGSMDHDPGNCATADIFCCPCMIVP